MPGRRSKQRLSEFTTVAMRVDAYEVEAEASLNYSLKWGDTHYASGEEPVFTHLTSLELTGVVLFPKERAGHGFRITLRGEYDRSGWLRLKLKDVEKQDERGLPVFRKRKGESVPEYDPPPGIAVLEKERGKDIWTAWITIQPSLASDMSAMLLNRSPLYLVVRERKLERRRWVESISLRTKEPDLEDY